MKTELKDVIHLYLGCEVQTGYRTESTKGQPMNKSIGILIDVDLLIPGAIGVQFEWQKASMDSTTLPINSCKLILRHLNDMEDEHKKFLYPFADGYLELSFIDSIRVDAEITNYLIKKQYDLFGLIEKNQAINKKSKK